MKLLPLLLIYCLLPTLVRAEPQVPVDVLIAQLDAESFKDRTTARKALVERIHDPSSPGLSDLLAARYANSPEIREQANLALREIFDLQVLGRGRREAGAEWTYWIDFKKGKTLAYPFIRSLKPDGYLAKGGVLQGDVLSASSGKTFDRRGSVSELKEMLENAPEGRPLVFTVLRGDPGKPCKDRIKTLQLTVVPINTERSSGRTEKPDEFNSWLKSLGKTGTVPADPGP